MLSWNLKQYKDLSLDELYDLLKLRTEVFVVEQNCVFQDMDDKDQAAFHLMGWKEGKLVAYSRLLAPGTAFSEMSIGRVITAASARRLNLGKELMDLSIVKIRELFGKSPIRIGAQLYLQKFYSSFGFSQVGEIYIEDGIPHIEMLLISNESQ